MKVLSASTLAAALLACPFVHAKTVSSVDVQESLTIQSQVLELNGAGIRSKFFIDLYVGSLYLPTTQHSLVEVLEQSVAVIRLNITSGMISSDKMVDAITDGFESATDGDVSTIEAEISQFMGLFNAEINQGDQFTFILTKNEGTASFKNGQPQGEIKGERFRQALLKIWLGDKPAQDSLKKSLLGL
ncbi:MULTISPECIES: chalcone isomerase family protein [Pseudomonadati]|uniref:Chalcone isomerase family protein n=1 Tax=Shewanella aestuarii TaxID=1028752 RepID=A0ABT0L1Y8_9GAMM|nr:chalcone isomerase family protein [Shewanella aestuarii]MCL1117741.1 chalcone isomerase family protein [Shewanella aestuarii]GGN76790.1 chalcone isomerase [Shewanella aestuarii]